MRKRVLEQNILPTAKQRIVVQGLAAADILLISRDPIDMKLGVIALPDQTRVPGGRRRAGDFKVTMQFADDSDRNAFNEWFKQCVDDGTPNGIDANYKKDATMTYLRLYSGKQAVTVSLFGCWPSSANLPNYGMDDDDGANGDTKLEVTVNFDDVELVGNSSLLNSIGQAALTGVRKKLTTYSYQAAAEAAVGLLL